MTKPSGYLEAQKKIRQALMEETSDTIRQYCFDIFSIALHKKHHFGCKRIKELKEEYENLYYYYWPALQYTHESDVFQERLDREVMAYMSDEEKFYPFEERYPNIKRLGYGPRGGKG